jgi:hypothetical protein
VTIADVLSIISDNVAVTSDIGVVYSAVIDIV